MSDVGTGATGSDGVHGAARGVLAVSKLIGRSASQGDDHGVSTDFGHGVARQLGAVGHWLDGRNPSGLRGGSSPGPLGLAAVALVVGGVLFAVVRRLAGSQRRF